MLLPASCGWSGSQQAIADDWAESAETLSEGDWEAAWPLLSSGTRLFLDSAAAEMERLGARGYPTGKDLLAVTFPGFFDLSGEPTLILQRGDSVRLEIAGSERTATRWMAMEDGRWRIDLEQPYRDSISAEFEGAYLDPSVLVRGRHWNHRGKE